MPYLNQDEEDPRTRVDQQMGAFGGSTGAAQGAGGGGGTAGGKAGGSFASGGSGAAGGANGNTGTGYVNFQRVLAANGQQAQGMADQTGARIEGHAGSYQQGLSGMQDKFSAGLNASGGYKGPASLSGMEGYGRIANQAGNVGGEARAAGSQGGLEALAQKQYGHNGHGYSGGMGAMDAALTGAAGGSKLQGLSAKYGNLAGQLANYSAQSVNQAEEAKQHPHYSATDILPGMAPGQDKGKPAYDPANLMPGMRPGQSQGTPAQQGGGDVLNAAGQRVGSTLNAAGQQVGNTLNQVGQNVGNAFGAATDPLKNGLTNFWNGILGGH